tara:strand:- start:521 stop:628 length:108 start_codon:yes stop_codon:yes gene_type:complete
LLVVEVVELMEVVEVGLEVLEKLLVYQFVVVQLIQ